MLQYNAIMQCYLMLVIIYYRKNEAINRPKSDFVPTSLSDLNMDTLSLGSNNDRYNNNSSNNFGGRFNNNNNNNLNKSKANLYASQQNLSSSKHSNFSTTAATTPMSSNSFNRSKIYGSQSSISTSSSGYRSVNVNNNNNNNGSSNSNNVTTSPVDNWLNAWDDNNNFQAQASNRPPSYQIKPNQQQQVRQHTTAMFSTSKPQSFNDKFNFEKPKNLRQTPQNDDPWAGELRQQKKNKTKQNYYKLAIIHTCKTAHAL